MDHRLPVRVIGGCLGLAAFAIAIVSGLASNAEASDILVRALISLFACHFVGTLIAMAMNVAVSENVTQYERANPLKPGPPASSAAPAPSTLPGA